MTVTSTSPKDQPIAFLICGRVPDPILPFFWPHSIPSITVIKFRPLMFANLPQFVDSPKLLGMMGGCSKALAGGWEFHIRDVSFERCVCWMNAYNRYSYSTPLHSTAVCYVYILVYTCSLIYTCTYAQLPFWRHLVPLLAHNHVFLYQILLSVLNSLLSDRQFQAIYSFDEYKCLWNRGPQNSLLSNANSIASSYFQKIRMIVGPNFHMG